MWIYGPCFHDRLYRRIWTSMIVRSCDKREYCFIRLTKCLSNQSCRAVFPLAKTESCVRSTESPGLGGVTSLNAGHCNRCGVKWHFNWSSLLKHSYETKNTFFCLYIICVSSLMRCLWRTVTCVCARVCMHVCTHRCECTDVYVCGRREVNLRCCSLGDTHLVSGDRISH